MSVLWPSMMEALGINSPWALECHQHYLAANSVPTSCLLSWRQQNRHEPFACFECLFLFSSPFSHSFIWCGFKDKADTWPGTPVELNGPIEEVSVSMSPGASSCHSRRLYWGCGVACDPILSLECWCFQTGERKRRRSLEIKGAVVDTESKTRQTLC